MKKLITIIILFLICLSSYSQDKLQLKSNLEFGIENRSILFTPEIGAINDYTYLMNSMVGRIDVKASYKGFFMYCSDNTYLTKGFSIYFSPKQIEYRIGGGFTYKAFTLNYEHMCSHTIEKTMFNEYYDRIVLRVTLKNY